MEEDIKTLEEFIEYSQEIINDLEYKRPVDVTIYQNEIQALEHLIKGYKQLVEENEELKQRLHRVCKEANKVEWETHSMIPVSLIKKKIEEYTKLLKNCNRFSDVDRIKAVNERILACKELLERGNINV